MEVAKLVTSALRLGHQVYMITIECCHSPMRLNTVMRKPGEPDIMHGNPSQEEDAYLARNNIFSSSKSKGGER